MNSHQYNAGTMRIGLNTVRSILYKTNRFHVAVGLFSNRSQKMSKCSKNITDTLVCSSCATSLFLLPHFDIVCDLLLNRCQGSQQIFKQEVITDKVGGSSAKPEVSKQSKEKRPKHKVSGYKSQSKRRSIAGCRLLLRTLDARQHGIYLLNRPSSIKHLKWCLLQLLTPFYNKIPRDSTFKMSQLEVSVFDQHIM